MQPALKAPRGVRLPQLIRKAIPKNSSRVTETISHKVFMGKRNSEFAVGASQRVLSGDTSRVSCSDIRYSIMQRPGFFISIYCCFAVFDPLDMIRCRLERHQIL